MTSKGSVRWSYMRYGCTPVVDNERTYAYHLWACSQGKYPRDCMPQMEDCSCDLDDAAIAPVDPITDPAPWYDPNVPESEDFLGVMILRIDGVEDSTYSRESFDAFNTGTILARPRTVGKSFVVRAMVLSTSCEGNSYGMDWLRKVLEDGSCVCESSDPCERCGENQLALRKFCGDDEVCDTGLREWDSVGVVDGISVVDSRDDDACCCVMRQVTWTMQSEGAHSFTCTETELDTVVRPNWYGIVQEHSPTAWWRHGEASGAAMFDNDGLYDGAYVGSPTLGAAGPIVFDPDTAVTLDGATQYGEVPYDAALNPATFSVGAWFRTSGGAGSRYILSTQDLNAGNFFGYQLYVTGGVLVGQLGEGDPTKVSLNGGAGFDDGQWHFAMMTYDGATASIYADGAFVQSMPATYSPNTVSPFRVGLVGNAAVGYFPGDIDETMLFSGVLSAGVISDMYDAGIDPPYTRCFDWQYDCHECCDQSQCNRCGYDALCTCFPPEQPVIEVVGDDCYCEPLQRTVECVCIDDVGVVADTALTIDIFSGDDATDATFEDIGMRNVRIRAWDNPDMLPCPVDDATYEAFCTLDPRFDLKVAYIPPNATLSIDGRRERVVLNCDGECRPYAQVVSATTGSIFPLIANCDPLTICIEFDVLNTQYDADSPKVPSHLTVTSHQRWRN